jgi:predicted  nucleic acid-binding Zn-ribbon protein
MEDRRLSMFEHKLRSIPIRLQDLEADLKRLEDMLQSERQKSEETRAFQASQEAQLADEEELIRQSKAKLSQATTTRELNATQREIETTRRMAAARSQEIQKLGAAASAAEERIASMDASLGELRDKAKEEQKRLEASQASLERRIQQLRTNRDDLTKQIDMETLRTYERIRTRMGGIAFVASNEERCSACKMQVPHQLYVRLIRGNEILACEHCGRLQYWAGHFPEELQQDSPDEAEPEDGDA